MTSRLLPPSEWPRLAGTEAERLWPLLNPTHDRVIVIEINGQIVGCVPLFWALHADGLWIDPRHQGKAGVFRALWRAVEAELGGRHVVVPVRLRVMRKFFERIKAIRLPGEVFVWASKRP